MQATVIFIMRMTKLLSEYYLLIKRILCSKFNAIKYLTKSKLSIVTEEFSSV